MNYGDVVDDWHKLEGFITSLRNDRARPTAFQEFEWLAKKFIDKPLKKRK